MKGIIKKLSKSKVLVGLCLGTLLIMGVSAFYFFAYDKTITGFIVGSEAEKITIVYDLSDYDLNVSEGLTNLQTLTLNNPDGTKILTKNLTITKVNNDLSCLNYDSDCSVVLLNSTGGEVENTFELFAGNNDFDLKTECINERSCPQNISIELILSETI